MDFVGPLFGGELGTSWLVGVGALAFLVMVVFGMVRQGDRKSRGAPPEPRPRGADKGLSTDDFAPGMDHVLGGGTPSFGPPPPAATLEDDGAHTVQLDEDDL
jgi:hypothetical protein